MVSYYNPLGMYQKGGGQCGHGHGHGHATGWYQSPAAVLDDTPSSWHTAHHMAQAHAHAHAHGHMWPPHGPAPPEWSTPVPGSLDRPPSAGSPRPPSSPVQRAPPPRSPYEWMKKPSYQNQQPNPVTALTPSPSLLEYSQMDPSGKTRTKDKYRVVYTDHQRLELEKEFHYSRYITIRRKAELAANLGLSERQVKIWFQNRRAKERKQVKKREEVTSKDKVLDNHSSLHQLHQHSAGLHHQQNMLHQSALAHQSLTHAGLGHQGISHQGLNHQGLNHQSLHQGLNSSQSLQGVPSVQLI